MPSTDRLDARLRGNTTPRPPRRRPRAAIVLIGVLAIAWLALQGRPSSTSRGAPPATVAPPPDPSALLAAMRVDPAACVDLVGDVPAVSCMVDGVQVEAKLFRPDEVTSAYVSATGARLDAATGPPACAAGHEEERSWSRPQAPLRPVGRYACHDGAMWWTDDHGVLAHATVPGRDLAQLFAWWRAHLLG